MDTLTGISKILLVGGDAIFAGLPIDNTFRPGSWCRFLSSNVSLDTGVIASPCNKIELETFVSCSIPVHSNAWRDDLPLFFTSDNTFGIKITDAGKVQAIIGNDTITSNITLHSGEPGYTYIRLTCENQEATLYVFRRNSGYPAENVYDTAVGSYSTLPLNNQHFNILGKSPYLLSFARIKKDGKLVYYGIPAYTVTINNAIYDRCSKTYITGSGINTSTESGSVGGTFAFCNATSIDCKNYKWINPSNLISAYYGFRDSRNLQTVTNLNRKIQFLDATFTDCSNLVNVPVIPDSVPSLRGTFSGCTSLVNAPVIPESVTDMRDTFSNCTSLVNAPIIPNSVTSLDGTFRSCTSLVNAPIIPNSVTGISGTFSNCANLINVSTIPDSVINMSYTFSNCTNLVNGTDVPDSVVNMYNAFSGCDNLIGTINIYSSNVTNASGCFQIYNTRPSTLTVHVPANSTTYNTFLAEGYNAQGTKDRVILLADL